MSATRDAEQMHTPLLDAYLTHLREEVAANTYRDYARVLRLAHAELPLGVIIATETELRQWLAGKGGCTDTRRVYRQAIAGLHRWLIAHQYSDYDPTALLPRYKVPQRLPRPVPSDQLARVLNGTREPVRLWCQIMYYTGARCMEVARLHREHVTPEATRLYGKGDRHRVVPTHAALWPLVEPLPPGPIVTVVSTAKRVSELVANELDRIGLPDVTAHRLRHTLATELLTQTGDLRLVQEMLGHASPATTAVYAAVVPARLAAAVASIPTPGTAPAAVADS